MKIFWATLGGFALKLLWIVLTVLIVALFLWKLLPAAFPLPGFDYSAALALTGVLYLVKAIFK